MAVGATESSKTASCLGFPVPSGRFEKVWPRGLSRVLRDHRTAGDWLFPLSLWFSSMILLWMSQGWIALFFCGQMFPLASWVMKRLVKRTPLRLECN